MAFYDPKDENKDKEAEQTNQTIGQESSVISPGGSNGTESAAGAAATGAAGAAAGTPFVGITDYINANKSQTAKLANKVGSYVEGQGNNFRETLGGQQKLFNDEVGNQTVNLNQDLINTASNVGQGAGAESLNDQQKADFQKMRDAQYKGPNSLEESDFFNPIDKAYNSAKSATEQSTDVNGQKNLLSQFQQDTRGRVNQGAAAFDSALLQGDEEARNTLANSAKKNADLGDLLSGASSMSSDSVNKAKQTTSATAKAIADAFGQGGVQSKLENSLNDKASQTGSKAAADAQAVLTSITNGQPLTDAQLGLVGISRGDYDNMLATRDTLRNTYGRNNFNNLAAYGSIVNPAAQINAQNIASAEDYARYAALNDLMGTKNQFLSDPTKAGTANLDVLDYNSGLANSDINSSLSSAKSDAAQQAAQQAAKAAAEAEEKRRNDENKATATGAGVGMAIAGPVGSVIGGLICFLGNTPILMQDGSYKMVQDLQLGDETAYGGKVLAAGRGYCDELIEYQNRYTSVNHAIFDGKEWRRAKDLEHGVSTKLDVPTIVYPIVNEKHILISDNGVVYADLIEHDDTTGLSDLDKILYLNTSKYIAQTIQIENEINEEDNGRSAV